jgi:eukaryotic-like serine/threonine-protein kinase
MSQDLGLASTLAVPSPALDATAVDFGKGRTLGLGATMAAPLPSIEIEDLAGTSDRSLKTTNGSVLPRLETGNAGTKLLPSEGRRYESVRTLGRGGMGEVALAEDRDIGRTVAVKKLLETVQGPAAVARFVDEVRTIGRLEHPNIVPIHDVGVDENGSFFFVMKYVEGETLESIIERLKAGDAEATRVYDMTRRVEIFIGILRALHYAHEKGIIHRDIKPANVMVGRHGEVILMDWGVARPIGGAREGNAPVDASVMANDAVRASATNVGSLIGTPLYMSPEQSRGGNDLLDTRSDLFSACILFDELLALRHRFESATSLPALLNAIQTFEPPPAYNFYADTRQAGIPAEYCHFLRKGLSQSPKDRWQSADEMIFELHAMLEGNVRVQCPATMNKRMAREMGRFVDKRPRLSIVAVALGSILMLVLLANALHDLIA